MHPQLPDGLVRIILICSVYLLLFLAVRQIIYPLQQMIAPDAAQYAALIFLPHGVRVIATWLYREKAIVPLLLAHFILYRLFYWQGGFYLISYKFYYNSSSIYNNNNKYSITIFSINYST